MGVLLPQYSESLYIMGALVSLWETKQLTDVSSLSINYRGI